MATLFVPMLEEECMCRNHNKGRREAGVLLRERDLETMR